MMKCLTEHFLIHCQCPPSRPHRMAPGRSWAELWYAMESSWSGEHLCIKWSSPLEGQGPRNLRKTMSSKQFWHEIWVELEIGVTSYRWYSIFKSYYWRSKEAVFEVGYEILSYRESSQLSNAALCAPLGPLGACQEAKNAHFLGSILSLLKHWFLNFFALKTASNQKMSKIYLLEEASRIPTPSIGPPWRS